MIEELNTFVAPSTRPAPVETVTPLKPSEAMRIGILLYPEQAFVEMVSADGKRACALGTIEAGYGIKDTTIFFPNHPGNIVHRLKLPERPGDPIETRNASGRFNWFVPCPVHGCRVAALVGGHSVVAHLNDFHKWTRERIADWLEGQGL